VSARVGPVLLNVRENSPTTAGAPMPDASDTESASRSRTTTDGGPTVADSLRDSGRSIAEITHYIGHLICARLDQLKLSIRTLVLYAILGVLGIIVAATVLAVAVVLLFTGIAHGLGAALGGRDWLGDLIVGFVVLGAIALSATLLFSKFKTASRRRTMRKYEERRKQQREQFGHDVADRAVH
jgi:hypothetical protein